MAKARAKKVVEVVVPAAASDGPGPAVPLEPQQVHELFGLPGPYEPPPPPTGLAGFVTFWDPVRRDS